MPHNDLSIDGLALRCAEETRKFIRQQNHDTQFCFELLRRALLEGNAEAFTHVFRVYESQVISWVYQQNGFPHTGEDADYFAGAAFANFYQALQGEKFSRFETLAQVLAYLKVCVFTAVAQYARDERRLRTTPIDDVREPGYTPDFTREIESQELWDHIQGLLANPEDRELARMVFIQQRKPAEIAEAFPTRWATPREVSVALQRIRRTLRRDPLLRGWAGVDDGADDAAD